MLTAYISAAMRHARYELLDDGTYYGQVAELEGVFANQDTLEATREELQSVLEGWLLLGLRLGHPIPALDGIELTPALAAV